MLLKILLFHVLLAFLTRVRLDTTQDGELDGPSGQDGETSEGCVTTGVHAHGLHALADICLLDIKKREQLSQEIPFSSGQQCLEPSYTQSHEEREPFPDEVLRTLCLMRNTSANLKKLLAIPEENENKATDHKAIVQQPMENQKSKKLVKSLPNHKIDRELEKMLK